MGITASVALKQAKDMIATSDEDNSGTIGFDEFAAIWQRKLLSVNDSYIHAVFSVLDENGDGEIDNEELAKVLDERDMKKIKALIKEVDTDGDGKINFEEFCKAMKESDVDIGGKGGGDNFTGTDLPDMDVNLDSMKD